MQGIQKDLTCPLCLELFRAPVTPECGHTFCQGCLTEAQKNQDQNGSTPCPTCQSPCRPETLQINRQLEHLVQSFKQVPQGHCLEHMDPLSVYCEQDKELICGVCASLGKHKGHNIITSAEAFAKLKRQLPQQQIILQEAILKKEKMVAVLDRQVTIFKNIKLGCNEAVTTKYIAIYGQTIPVLFKGLNKILSESPPPGRLDIQLPIISDEFKF
ncbi:hypothetical protein XELAEV_18002375mg [Xenopus laevis]|nr:hypothetical protein XELAEV_18002375mg [Xenopus laevis]